MLLNAPRTSPGARALQSRAASLRVFPASSSILLGSANCQQSRDFRFGAWATGSDECPGEPRRRPRTFRYRYMESVTRNLSWENIPRGESSKAAMKKAMAQFAKAGNKYINVDEVKSWSDEVSGVRPGKNIEDVERSAIDHLFQNNKPTGYAYNLWKSPLRNIRKNIETHRAPKEVTPEEVLHATTSAEKDTSIDPITNRRIHKSNSSPKYEDLDKYGPIMDQTVATKSEGKEPYEDLDKYGPVVDGDKDPRQQKPGGYDDLEKYGPIRWNEPDGLRKTTPEENSKNYKDLDKYASSKLDDPFAQRKLSQEEQSKYYDDLHKYKPVHWNEPDGLRQPTAEELSKNYDDLHMYGAVRWNEPDGLRKPTPEELSKNYKDLGEYGPVTWNEPDGLRRLTPEEESKKYEDLDAYSTPFVAKDSVLKAYEASQMDATPKAEPLAAKVEVASEDPAKEYDDLDKYGPVHWNEPDGLRKLTPEELSKNYDDLHLYGATRWNEPDGLRRLTPEEKSKHYRDLSEYAPRDNTPIPPRRHPEEVSKDYKDLDKYAQYDNGDSNQHRIHPEEASKQYDDLHKYSAFSSRASSRLHPEEASKQYKDLSKYPASSFTEPDQTTQVHPEELTKNYEDLDKYQPTAFDSADQGYPVHPEEASKQYSDLQAYKHKTPLEAFTSSTGNHPDGSSTASSGATGDSPSDDGSKAGSQPIPDGSSITHRPRGNRFFPDFTETNIDAVDELTARDIRASTLRRAWQGSRQQKLDEAKNEHDSSWDRATEEVVKSLRNSEQGSPGSLTGNYARDFPEEFSTSWGIVNSASKSTTLLPEDQIDASEAAVLESGIQSEERDADEFGSMDESFPVTESRVQSALERGGKRRYSMAQATMDPYSKVPQGLETSFASESVGEANGSIVVKHYGSKKANEEDKPAEAACAQSQEPESYKVLAYDPEMQTVSVAETTSAVHSTTSPSTPADVLLKLSNPSKFLPHFEPLESQGYEIVSGGGNVLVFRKARPASATASAKPMHMSPTRINPIDMMGKPVSGNFASPTGFVNYETLAGESAEKPAPPFRWSVDSDKQEPGEPKLESAKQRSKKSLGKKMVMGTVWVAGSAYAVGVVGEYFGSKESNSVGQKRL